MSNIRPLSQSDVPALAQLFHRSRGTLTFLPPNHSVDSYASFLGNHVVGHMEVFGIEKQDRLAGFIALAPDWIEHLYLDPDFFGRGIGTELVVYAKTRQDKYLLWCFQENTRALGFYEKHGFSELERTDGANNMEKCPDVLLRWNRAD